MTTDPVTDADRYLTRIDAEADALEKEERELADCFMNLAMLGDMKAKAVFAPRRQDYLPGRGWGPHRHQTADEVMESSLDYGNGPNTSELMALLVQVAKGVDSQAAALDMIKRMAAKWAQMNAGRE